MGADQRPLQWCFRILGVGICRAPRTVARAAVPERRRAVETRGCGDTSRSDHLLCLWHATGRGSRDQTGEIFVCVDRQADAKKFIEIQDAIRGPAGDSDARVGELSEEAEKPKHP
jgi:hypothetical protein